MDKSKDQINLTGVEETALLTVYAKAIESQSENPILKDERIEALVQKLDTLLERTGSKMAKILLRRSIDARITVHMPIRAKKYDAYAADFLERHPAGAIINLGCGLDTRFFRIDNGQMQFFDLDLPEMIALKQGLVEEHERYHLIGQSVLDFSWMDRIARLNRPVLILAEGIFMYLPEERVKALVLELQKRFPNSELVCELTNRTWVEGFWGKMAGAKMKQRFKMTEEADFKFGVSGADELETWGEGIEFREMWFYMDDNHPKLGWMRILRKMKIFRDAQFTAHYILHAA